MNLNNHILMHDISLFSIKSFSNAYQCARSGIIYGDYDGKEIALIVNSSYSNIDDIDSKYSIVCCDKKLFNQILEKNFSNYSVFLSSYNRIFIDPKSSAYILENFVFRLKIFFTSLLFASILVVSGFACLIVNIFCLAQTFYKFYIFKSSLLINSSLSSYDDIKLNSQNSDSKINQVNTSSLPFYTILIPLYREAGKINSIIDVINKIDYPKEKLDVKLILEEDDTQTIKAVQIIDLENYYHVIKVPNLGPRTKPKACNYAMNFARGDLVVIYDAEDKPEASQLMKAVNKFNSLGNEYICLQARLEIDMSPKTFLNTMFKLEYDLWFKFFLKGLTRLNMPITLGGTSNHFKTEYLKQLGFWDAYNVTEDAEMGIRINSFGYKIDMLDSYTIEEGPISITSWFKQRLRWTKGFIVTFISLLMYKKANHSYKDRISIIIFSILGTIMLPLGLVDGYFHGLSTFTKIISGINTTLFLLFFWSVAYFLSKLDKELSREKWLLVIALFPFYFILHVIASYGAIIEIMISPFGWNKTDHNIQ